MNIPHMNPNKVTTLTLAAHGFQQKVLLEKSNPTTKYSPVKQSSRWATTITRNSRWLLCSFGVPITIGVGSYDKSFVLSLEMTLMLVCLGHPKNLRLWLFAQILSFHIISVHRMHSFIANLSLNLLITWTTGMKPHLKLIGIHWIWGWVDIVFVKEVYIDIPHSSRYAQVKNPVWICLYPWCLFNNWVCNFFVL